MEMRKHWKTRLLVSALLLMSCFLASGALALTVSATLEGQTTQCVIHSVDAQEGTFLLLPAFADLHNLQLSTDHPRLEELVWENESGEQQAFAPNRPMDWLTFADETENGHSAVLKTADGELLLQMHVLKSENLRAMFLTSENPEYDRVWLEDCLYHERLASADMMLLSTNGHTDSHMRVEEIRGRGNGTWAAPKHAYQIKLEKKANLLKTDRPQEANKTWILLANAFDPTLLRNRFVMDMALEMGMKETSRSESIDLYYDGEYRGNYLLCEKVEVKPGRVELEEADAILELLNGRLTDHLEAGQDVNEYGLPYSYLEGFRDGGYVDGSYMLEMEYVGNTLSQRCFFTLSDNTVWGLKSPADGSRNMMRYISEATQEAWDALIGMGVNPHTGKKFEEYFDAESFVIPVLMGEVTYNVDAFAYSSTFLIKEAYSSRFRCGPVWDYDLSCTYRVGKDGTEVTEYKTGELTQTFLAVPAFRKLCQRFYLEQMYPLMQAFLFGEEDGKYLKTLDHYVEEIRASQRMNEVIWGVGTHHAVVDEDTFEASIESTRDFLDTRTNWFKEEAESWQFDHADENHFTLTTYYGMEIAKASIKPNVGTNARVRSMTVEEGESEFLDEEERLFVVEVVVEPLEGYAFTEDTVVNINYEELTHTVQEDGSLHIECCFLLTLEDEVLYGGANNHWFDPYMMENDW